MFPVFEEYLGKWVRVAPPPTPVLVPAPTVTVTVTVVGKVDLKVAA